MLSVTVCRIAACAALVGSAMGLAGCGGGAAGSLPDDAGRSSASATRASSVTVPEYQLLRARTATVAGGVLPDATAMAALQAENHHLAVAQMQASDLIRGYTNRAVVPTLTYATLRSLGAAASGDSLAEISSRFDLAPTPYVAAQQTARVASQLWVQRGHRLHSEFLVATDARGPWPQLAAWSAAETGFADGSAGSDALMAQALSAASPGLSLWQFRAQTDIRLLVAHSLTARAGWGAVTPFTGVYERGYHDLVRLPLLRLRSGVMRHTGTDFTADVLRAGDLHLMTLRPAAGSLHDFAADRLEPALAEVAQALLSSEATPAAGEMVLHRPVRRPDRATVGRRTGRVRRSSRLIRRQFRVRGGRSRDRPVSGLSGCRCAIPGSRDHGAKFGSHRRSASGSPARSPAAGRGGTALPLLGNADTVALLCRHPGLAERHRLARRGSTVQGRAVVGAHRARRVDALPSSQQFAGHRRLTGACRPDG